MTKRSSYNAVIKDTFGWGWEVDDKEGRGKKKKKKLRVSFRNQKEMRIRGQLLARPENKELQCWRAA